MGADLQLRRVGEKSDGETPLRGGLLRLSQEEVQLDLFVLAMLEASISPNFRRFEAAQFILRFRNDGNDLDRFMIIVDCDEGEIGGEDLLLIESPKILCDHLHPHFHRSAPGPVDGTFADQNIAVVSGMDEADRVDSERYANLSAVPLAYDGGQTVGDLEDLPSEESAVGIQVVGEYFNDLIDDGRSRDRFPFHIPPP